MSEKLLAGGFHPLLDLALNPRHVVDVVEHCHLLVLFVFICRQRGTSFVRQPILLKSALWPVRNGIFDAPHLKGWQNVQRIKVRSVAETYSLH